MEIVYLTKDQYMAWDKFCLESDDAWFWHTTKWLDYCVLYGLENYKTQNLSFLVMDDSSVLAIYPLLLEKKKGDDGVSYRDFSTSESDGYGVIPALRNDLSEERREKIYKFIVGQLDLLAKQHRVLRSSFCMTPLALENSQYNWLLKYEYFDASINTQIIDLSPPIEELKGVIRKGHKYDINRGEKHYKIHIYSKDNPSKEAFEMKELKKLVADIRRTEKIIGNGEETVLPVEEGALYQARRGLYA